MTPCSLQRQQGAVLIVALIFLVILTMLGVTAMTGTTMELRMAGNTRDLSIALQAAESAIRDAENDIARKPYTGKEASLRTPEPLAADFGAAGLPGTCNSVVPFIGLCAPVSDPVGPAFLLPRDLINEPLYSLSGSPAAFLGQYTGGTPLKGVSQQPHYTIERFCGVPLPPGLGSMGSPPKCNYYRITARGYGANPNSRVTLSEVYNVLD